MFAKKQKFGFTLIELVTTITIIGLLAALVAVSTINLRKNARDTQRKNDLKTIQNAIEAFVADSPTRADDPRRVPGEVTSAYNSTFYNSQSAGAGCAGAPWIPELVPQYLSKVPCDPVNSLSNSYTYAPRFLTNSVPYSYVLYTELERQPGNGANYGPTVHTTAYFLDGGAVQ